MSIKAGRVGVAPDQVDEFGNINSEATSGYTKQEADAKFETQLHATSTYETKSEATAALAEKQPIRLTVPIQMLEGSQLVAKNTVEDVIQTMNNSMTPKELTDAMQVEDILSELTINEGTLDADSFAKKCGNQIFMGLKITGLTATSYSTVIVSIPRKYAPPKATVIYGRIGGVGIKDLALNVGPSSCNITSFENIDNKTLTIGNISWIIS